MPPDFVEYESAQEYFEHFKDTYCRATITTVDGIRVYFKPDRFWHAFYEANNNTGRKEQQISQKRAKRIDWIKEAIESASAGRYKGWHQKSGHIDERCVNVIYGDYVVVLAFFLQKDGGLKANFVTAFLANKGKAIEKIKKAPIWSFDDCLAALAKE